VDLLIARNPEAESSLAYLLRLPVAGGLVFRTSDTWPRTKALYCHPMAASEWPEEPEIVERVALRSCTRRGAAIDVVLDRARENRSQLVFTTARGREMVFWQSARTRKQARPNVHLPTARAAGIPQLHIIVDTHERYAYRFGHQAVQTSVRPLRCGDYAVMQDDRVVAAVERKSLPDLVASVTSGRLRFALTELACLPRAAVMVEDRYSEIFKLTRVRPAVVSDGLAELQVRWPTVPIVFGETRALAEDWTYRYLAAAAAWAETERAVSGRLPGLGDDGLAGAPMAPAPSPGELRRWALAAGMDVPSKGRVPVAVRQAWEAAHRGSAPELASEPESDKMWS
jgi:hypothetical protein